MKKITLYGMPFDFDYSNELLEDIIKNKPEIVAIELPHTTKPEDNEVIKPLAEELIKNNILIVSIGPSKNDFNNKGLRISDEHYPKWVNYMEVFIGEKLKQLLKENNNIALIIGGSHLPLNYAPVETPLINTLINNDYELMIKIKNYLPDFMVKNTVNHVNQIKNTRLPLRNEDEIISSYYKLLRYRLIQEVFQF